MDRHNQGATVSTASETTPKGVTVLMLVGVGLLGTQHGLAPWPPGLQPYSATTRITSCQALHSWMCLMQFLNHLLSSWWWHDHSCSPQPSSTLNSSFLLQYCCNPPFSSWEGQPWSTNLLTWARTVSLSVHTLICLAVTGDTVSKCSWSNRRLPGTGTTVGVWGSGKRLRASAWPWSFPGR